MVATNRRHCVYELPVEGELLAALCRRGRRRLRDVQAACGVSLRLDRAGGLLLFSGTPEDAAMVRKHLAGLVGPRRNVPPEVWAELMRTRTILEGEEATVIRMQEACGCRIHIERFRSEVRIFGENANILAAERLLEELGTRVAQEALHVPDTSMVCTATLQGLAYERGVTLRIDPESIVVLGLRFRVAGTIEHVREYLQDPHNPKFAGYKEKAELAQQHMVPEARDGNSDDDAQSIACSAGGIGMEPSSSMPFNMDQAVDANRNKQSQRMGLQTAAEGRNRVRGGKKERSPVGALVPVQMQQQHHQHQQHQHQHTWSSTGMDNDNGCCMLPGMCPTCGCGRFCAHCGMPVAQAKPMSMDLASYAAFAVQMPHAPNFLPGKSGHDTPDSVGTRATLDSPTPPDESTTPSSNHWIPAGQMTNIDSARMGHSQAYGMIQTSNGLMPTFVPMCLVPAQGSNGGSQMMQAYMMPAPGGWMMDSTGSHYMQEFAQVSPTPTVEHLP